MSHSHFDLCSEYLEKDRSGGDPYVSHSHFDPCSECIKRKCHLVTAIFLSMVVKFRKGNFNW